MINLDTLQLHQLEELLVDVENKIRDEKYRLWKETRHTKEQIISMFSRFGFVVPKGSKIWRVIRKPGGYGMEIGSYDHSCDIDSSTYLALLVVNDDDSYVDSFSDMWLTDPIVI